MFHFLKLISVFIFSACLLVDAAPNYEINRRSRSNGRIVGGISVPIEQYPYQISLLYLSSHICGGSIVSDEWVVTAGHCVFNTQEEFLTVRVGSSRRNRDGEIIAVRNAIAHPDFDLSPVDYDIGVVHLDKKLTFSPQVQPVRLPNGNQRIEAGRTGVVTGWGALHEYGYDSDDLQAVNVTVMSMEKCRSAYSADQISDRMFCAGSEEGGKDACQGDSGGPLVVDGQLIGIVSWGQGCASPIYPGVYSNVIVLTDFIKKFTISKTN